MKQGAGFMVHGSWCRLQGSGLVKIWGLGLRVGGQGVKILGSGFRVYSSGLWYRVWGKGLRF